MSDMDVVALYTPKQEKDDKKLMKQVDYFSTLPIFVGGFNAINSIVLIVNSSLRAVFANKAFLHMVCLKEVSDIYGKSAGEIIKCIHSMDEENSCGKIEACRYCNIVNTVVETIVSQEEAIGEFSNINRMNGYENNINLSIHVAPLTIQDEIFYIITFTDKSDSIRKRMLERIFFHDIINTAGALKGIMSLLKEDVPDGVKPELEFVEESFSYLVEEIQTQKYMMDAEDNQLVLDIVNIETDDILKSIHKLYEGHDLAEKKTIVLDHQCIKHRIDTDPRLLRRILGNMIKNALEATTSGGKIIFGCSLDDTKQWTKFWVHNDQYMDIRVQSLIFHRSFSKKGDGRGLGTYSIKLFGEKFLKGKVGFLTSEEEGTTFYIKIPSALQRINK